MLIIAALTGSHCSAKRDPRLRHRRLPIAFILVRPLEDRLAPQPPQQAPQPEDPAPEPSQTEQELRRNLGRAFGSNRGLF